MARIKVPPLQSRTPNLEKPLPRAYNAVAGRIWKHKPLFSGYAIPRRTYRRGILRSVASNPRLSAKEPPRCGIPSSLRSFGMTQADDRAILSSRAQRGILRRTTSPARDAGDRDVDRYSEERSDEGTLDASHPDPGSLLAALVRDDIYNAREDAPCRPERPAGGGTLFRGSAYKGPFVAALLRDRVGGGG